jgi:hypothetical protein
MVGLAPRPWERTRSADSLSFNPAAKHPPETLEESLIAADQARRLMDRAIAGNSVTSGRVVLGDARQAWAWHGTAKSAADATTDRAVQAQVRAIGTLIPLYYGESGEAAALARDVRERITAEGNRVSASSVLAGWIGQRR